jgi:hypothetical protein
MPWSLAVRFPIPASTFQKACGRAIADRDDIALSVLSMGKAGCHHALEEGACGGMAVS